MRLLRNFILLSLLGFVCVGCLSVKYPNRQRYVFNIAMPKAQTQVSNKILGVNSVPVIPQFSEHSFMYRTSNINYIRDYYNMFFVLYLMAISSQ